MLAGNCSRPAACPTLVSAIPALMRYGKWAAVFIAAAIFSAGHFTNVFFESFGLLEWADKFPELLPAHTRWWRFEILENGRRRVTETAS